MHAGEVFSEDKLFHFLHPPAEASNFLLLASNYSEAV